MESSSKPANGEIIKESLPNWLNLPTDVSAKILHKLSAFEILTSASLVCPSWWKICKDPLMWRTIDFTNPPCYPNSNSLLVKLSCCAIERSCGHLEDISIESFGNDEVLKCIVDNGNHLRRMRLLSCWSISDKGLSEASKKLPMLEEFEISFSDLYKNNVKLLRQCCPFLKVTKLKLFRHFFKGFDCHCNDYTSGLITHIVFSKNRFDSDGVLTFLDGCDHVEVESLQLRACNYVDVSTSFGEPVCERINRMIFGKGRPRFPIQLH